MDSLVIVDCQYDFIDGSLACSGSHEAVAYLIDFINRHEVEVLYTSDWHSPTNQSFTVNGGIWPIHCVAGEKVLLWTDISLQILSMLKIARMKKIFFIKEWMILLKNIPLSME